MLALELIAERRLEEAIERGEFDNLPGAGLPLDLDDMDASLPEELRLAYRILKNAGMSSADMTAEETAERARARKKLAILEKRIEARYYELALAKLGR